MSIFSLKMLIIDFTGQILKMGKNGHSEFFVTKAPICYLNNIKNSAQVSPGKKSYSTFSTARISNLKGKSQHFKGSIWLRNSKFSIFNEILEIFCFKFLMQVF